MALDATISNAAPLRITSRTAESVRTLLAETGLYNLTPEELHATLLSCSSDGLCSRDEFVLLFSDLPTSNALFQVFDCFDRTDNSTVDLAELSIGLSLLCQGSKSTKLAFAFDLLDDDNDGKLTRRGIWRLLMSFLCVLLKVGGYFPREMTKAEICRVLDNISVTTASEILTLGASQKVSFEMISNWYLDKGYSNSSWIELLDLRKWVSSGAPAVKAAQESKYEKDEESDGDENEDEDEDEEDDYDDDDDDDEKIVYIASLFDDHSLVIKAQDTDRVFAISRTSGLDQIDPAQMVKLLEKYEGPSECIRADAFQHFLQNFIPLEDLSSEVREGLVRSLHVIFRVIEKTSGFKEGANIRSLSIGLSLFCAGNKSSKLSQGFHVFDVHRDGYLSRSQLTAFLASFLSVFTALGIIDSHEVALNTANFLAPEICGSIGSERITFGEFGEWYNDEGFKIAGWIELLNLEKWAKFTMAAVGGHLVDDSGDDSMEIASDDDDDDDEDEDEAIDEACTISLHNQLFEKVFDVSKSCINQVLAYKRIFSPRKATSTAFVTGIVRVSNQGLVRKSDYVAVMQDLGFDVKASLHSHGSFLLRLFDAFDRSGSGYADTTELITGLIILFDGSKSAKLMFSFELLDISKRGALTRSEMWRFFRSFLTTILLLCNMSLSDKMHVIVDDAAQWTVDDLVETCNILDDQTVCMITFEHFSAYYSERGFLVCSWLELLDLEKMALLAV